MIKSLISVTRIARMKLVIRPILDLSIQTNCLDRSIWLMQMAISNAIIDWMIRDLRDQWCMVYLRRLWRGHHHIGQLHRAVRLGLTIVAIWPHKLVSFSIQFPVLHGRRAESGESIGDLAVGCVSLPIRLSTRRWHYRERRDLPRLLVLQLTKQKVWHSVRHYQLPGCESWCLNGIAALFVASLALCPICSNLEYAWVVLRRTLVTLYWSLELVLLLHTPCIRVFPRGVAMSNMANR